MGISGKSYAVMVKLKSKKTCITGECLGGMSGKLTLFSRLHIAVSFWRIFNYCIGAMIKLDIKNCLSLASAILLAFVVWKKNQMDKVRSYVSM